MTFGGFSSPFLFRNLEIPNGKQIKEIKNIYKENEGIARV